MLSNLALFIQSKVLARILKCFENRNLASMYFKTFFDAIYFKRCIKANCLKIGELYDFINLFSVEKIKYKKSPNEKYSKTDMQPIGVLNLHYILLGERTGGERIFAIISSSVPNIVEHIFRNDCYLCAQRNQKRCFLQPRNKCTVLF